MRHPTMSKRTDTERLKWFLKWFGVDHERGRSFLVYDGPWLPDGLGHFHAWERAAIKQAGEQEVLLNVIDAAMDAEEGEG